MTFSLDFCKWVVRYRRDLEALRSLVLRSKDYAREFVRGFFDAEGHLKFYTYTRRRGSRTYTERRVKLKFVNTNRRLLEIVLECLQLLGFQRFHMEGPYMDAYRVTPKYELCTFSVKEARRFLEVVKPLKVS